MGVMLHGTVGLQHAAMAIYNAWCDRVPGQHQDVQAFSRTLRQRRTGFFERHVGLIGVVAAAGAGAGGTGGQNNAERQRCGVIQRRANQTVQIAMPGCESLKTAQ